MKPAALFFTGLVIILFGFREHKATPVKTNTAKWVSLFNGKNLDGWNMKISGYQLGENFGNTFRVEDGILRVRYNAYDSFKNRFGALYYNKKFTNYRLKVEYRFVGETTAGAPSWGFRDAGIQYHCQPPASIGLTQSFPVCLEYNLHGGNGKDDRPVGEICCSGIYATINGKKNSSYCTPAIMKRTFHGDQWVTAEIEVDNETIKHFVNGEEILQFTDPRYDTAHAIGKTFIANGDDRVRSGYISLQSNSHPIDFRKIEIMEY
ncbi:MAG: 3-keto-disaccharide hydrolase [Chitinophagaceae bacterium]